MNDRHMITLVSIIKKMSMLVKYAMAIIERKLSIENNKQRTVKNLKAGHKWKLNFKPCNNFQHTMP